MKSVVELERALESGVSSQERIDILIALAWEARNQNIERAFASAQEALSLSQTIDYREGVARSRFRLGSLFYLKSQYPLAVETLSLAVQELHAVGDKPTEALAYNDLANATRETGQLQKAMALYAHSLALKEEVGDKKGIAHTLTNFGIHFGMQGDYATAARYLIRGLRLREEINDVAGQAYSLHNIATLYHRLENNAAALDNYLRGIRLAEAANEKNILMNLHNDAGATYFELGQYNNAAPHLFRALGLAREFGSRKVESDALYRLALVIVKLGESGQAIGHFEAALLIQKEIGYTAGEIKTALRLGEVYEAQRKYEKAEEHLNAAIALCLQTGEKELLWQLYDSSAKIQAAKGDKVGSAAMREKARTARREIFNQERLAALHEQTVAFEIENSKRLLSNIDDDASVKSIVEIIEKAARRNAEEVMLKLAQLHDNSTVAVKTFGRFSVAINGKELQPEDWQRKKTRDVFKVLLLHYREPMDTAKFEDALWSETAAKNFESSLMKSLSQLRAAFQKYAPTEGRGYIKHSDKTYALDFGETAFVDFIAFKDLIIEARRLSLPAEKARCYNSAVKLYEGEFLKENLYDDWTTYERELLKDMALEARSFLATFAFEDARYDDAIHAAETMLALDRTAEIAFEILLKSLMKQGRRADAHKTYERCKSAFKAELGIDPPARFKAFLT